MTTQTVLQSNRRLMRRLLLLVAAMFGFNFVLVPFYDVICRVTGLNGKTSNTRAVVGAENQVDAERTVTVEFLANVNESAPWQFVPNVAKMQVHPGQFYHISYFAKNLTMEPLVGQAIPSVRSRVGGQIFPKNRMFLFFQARIQAWRRQGHAGDIPAGPRYCSGYFDGYAFLHLLQGERSGRLT